MAKKVKEEAPTTKPTPATGIPKNAKEISDFLKGRGIDPEIVFLESFETAEARRVRRKELDPYVHMLSLTEQKDKSATFLMIYKPFPEWLMGIRERDFEKNVANGIGSKPAPKPKEEKKTPQVDFEAEKEVPVKAKKKK